ncbi:MAG TPA: chitobiase/beta-hexosaminidase C-terminal domain-containing protein [Candidatus Angelobacter sp.]
MDWRKIITALSLVLLSGSSLIGQSTPTPDQAALLNQAFTASYSGAMMDQVYLLAHNTPEVLVADLNQRLAAYPGLVVPGTFLDNVADLYAFAATPSAIDALVQLKNVDPKYLKTITLLLFYAQDRKNPWDLCYYALGEDADTQQTVLQWVTTQVTHPAYYRLLATEMTQKYGGVATQAQLAADPVCSKLDPTMLPQLQRDIAALAQQQAPGYTPPNAPPNVPTFSPAGGTYAVVQAVALAADTPNAVIRYTVDGSVPMASSSVYNGPIAVTSATTITAVATAPGFINSNVSSATYVLQAAAPAFSPASGTYAAAQSVTLSEATPGAAVYYTTNGSTPTASSSLYSGTSIPITSTTTINAIAIAPGFNNSTVSSAVYTILTPASAPAFSPVGGTYNAVQAVTLSDSTQGSAIHYTTDGSTPTASSSLYSGTSITVTSTTTINAIAIATGFNNSPVVSATYTLQAATPTFSLASGTYTGAQSVAIADATSGAAIHYTTDGTTPTASSSTYHSAITVTGNMTINAIATGAGFFNSNVASASYVVHMPLATISSISPTTGSIGGGTTVTLTGANFRAGATVTLSGYGASSVNVVSSTQLTAVTPAHSAGTVSVVITNTDGQGGTLANSFSYFTPVNNISWVKPSGVSFGPANTLTVDGSALNGPSPVQTVWRDVTLNGPWNTIAAQSTPDGGGSWANTIPTSNYCHSYAIYANYLNVSSPTFTYVGVGSPYCNENAYVNWIEPPSMAGWGPAGSLMIQGNATGAPAGTVVAFFWSDVTAGTGWIQAASATPDASGTWYNTIPNVTYWHQYNVYVTYDAFDTRNAQGVCSYTANGGGTFCPR